VSKKRQAEGPSEQEVAALNALSEPERRAAVLICFASRGGLGQAVADETEASATA
jgi:hypothetical protein